jgi:hypothetical protein
MFEPDKDELLSRTIIDNLTADPEQPWMEYRHGKPITQKQLSALLRPYGITSETVHPPDVDHGKGYKRQRFEEAFERYLPASPENGISKRASVQVALPQGQGDQNRCVQEGSLHASKNDEFAYSRSGLHACTLENPEIGPSRHVEIVAEPSDQTEPAAAELDETTSTVTAETSIAPAADLDLARAKVETPKPNGRLRAQHDAQSDDGSIPPSLRRCEQCGEPPDATKGAVTERDFGGISHWLHDRCDFEL